MPEQSRARIFISYAHEDVQWRQEFERMFAPAQERGIIDVWSDDAIEAGENWFQNIQAALDKARVGLLLVTDHFLESKFVGSVELRKLLNAAKTRGASIRWVPISASLYQYTDLSGIQACWDPQNPLDKLQEPERKAAIHKICLEIVEQFGSSPEVSKSRIDALRSEIQERLGDKYTIKDEVASGKVSIVYVAERAHPKHKVAIKVLVASELDEWARRAFEENVGRALELRSPAFVRILDYSMDQTPEFLVSELITGKKLNSILWKYPNGLPLRRVKSILMDLAYAIEEAHLRGWRRGEICPSDVFIDESGLARLSPVDFTNILREQAQITGNFLVDRESLSYMAPERFYGHPPSPLTDQYSLGTIATELLGGPRMPRVVSPSDLLLKPQLFSDLEGGNGEWAARSPEFAGLVCRMLRVDPQERWPSIRDVRHLLREIEVAETVEERAKKVSTASYLRLQAKFDKLRAFFATFYKNLAEASPGIERYFEHIDMERQYKLLNQSILALLKFNRELPSTEQHLEELVVRHAKLGLSKDHYKLFLQTFLKTIQGVGEADPSQVSAWEAALTPAIEFMCQCEERRVTTTRPVESFKPRSATA